MNPLMLSIEPCAETGPCGWFAARGQVVTGPREAVRLSAPLSDITEGKLAHARTSAKRGKYRILSPTFPTSHGRPPLRAGPSTPAPMSKKS